MIDATAALRVLFVKPVLLSDQGLELTSVLQAASRIALDRWFTWPVVVVGAPVVFLQNKHFYVHVPGAKISGAVKDRLARELGAKEQSLVFVRGER